MNPSTPTQEDQHIILRLMRTHGYRIHEAWNSAAERCAWADYNIMETIERMKYRHRLAIRQMHIYGRMTG